MKKLDERHPKDNAPLRVNRVALRHSRVTEPAKGKPLAVHIVDSAMFDEGTGLQFGHRLT
jgi:hypothetical protein